MANLVELSQMAEDMPDEQLIQSTQGQGNLPPFVAITEIKRRTDLRKAYEAQQPKPQASVSEKLVAEFVNSPSGLGAMNQSPDLQQAFPSGDMGNMAPPSPMQMMASGGRTGYRTGSVINNEPIQSGFGISSFMPQSIGPFPTKAIGSLVNTYAPEELEKTKEILNSLPKNEDGSIDKSAIAQAIGSGLLTATAVAAVLAPEPTTTAAGAARLATTNLGKNIIGLPSKIKSGLQSIKRKIGERKMDKAGGAPIVSQMNPKTLEGIGGKAIKDLKLPTRIGGGAGLFGLSRIFGGSDEEEIKPLEALTQNESSQEQVLQDEITGDVNADKRLGQRLKDFATSSDNADLLIGLGGAIASARNIGELGSGISDAYRGVMADRAAVKQAGLQGRLLEAQISKIELEVANMPLNIAIKQYESLNDLVDSGVLTAEEAKIREIALSKRIQELQGITADQKSERDELLGLTKVV